MSTTVPYLIGVDGGATKTTALLSTMDGEIIGIGRAGPSNYQTIGIEAASAALNRALQDAFEQAGLPFGVPKAICLGLAGVDRPVDRALIQDWIKETLPGTAATILNDAALIPAAGTPDGWGVGLICGTGAIAYGRSPDGATARADGWGNIMGDSGSGYALGRAALRAVMAAFDGRGAQTVLSSLLLAHWDLSSATDLVQRIYVSRASPDEIASLAALVDQAATADDSVAKDLVRDAGKELANTIAAVIERLNLPSPTPAALAGGVLVHGVHTREALQSAAAARGLELDPVQIVARPADGALRMARLFDLGPNEGNQQ